MSQQQIVTEVEIGQAIDQALADNRIVLFMKGTPEAPACGFSLRTVQALQNADADYVATHPSGSRIRQVLGPLGLADHPPALRRRHPRRRLRHRVELEESGELAKVVAPPAE